MAAQIQQTLAHPFVVVDRPGFHALEIERAPGNWPFVRMRAGDGPAFLVPGLQKTVYLVQVVTPPVRLAFDRGEVRAARIRPAGLGDTLRGIERPRVRRRTTLNIADGVTLRPLLRGAGREGRDLVKALRLLTGWGFGLSSRNLQHTPGLFSEINDEQAELSSVMRPVIGNPRFVVALHLYYRDLWPEFAIFLRRVRRPFHLIVTISRPDDDFRGRVLGTFPGAEVLVMANRGRDVGPFLQLLHDGRFDAFEFICKLHGKRTATSGHRAILGQVWRRATVLDLIGSDEQVGRILAQFDSTPDIGMIGSPRFRLPTDFMPPRAAWGANKPATLALGARLGISQDDLVLDYFAGTMFWVRREVLRPLRQLGLTLVDFPEGIDERDGRLHHAIERLFGALPRCGEMLLANAVVEYRHQSEPGNSASPRKRDCS